MGSKIERDQATVRFMVRLYAKHHPAADAVSCQRLADYACQRLQHCKFGEQKPACKDCPIHCYKPDMRAQMQQVMRWAGPRMVLLAPRATLRHLWQSLKAKRARQ